MPISRRTLLSSIPALAFMPRVFGQTAKPVIPIRALNYLALSVSDMQRSIDFYQGLFGMPIQARQGANVLLRIGDGPQFLLLQPAGGSPPALEPRLGFSVDNFNADRLVGQLAQHGVTVADAAAPGLSGGAMRVRVSKRGADGGGAPGGTPELFFGDPDGLVIQIQDVSYAGGAGEMGQVVRVQASPKKGLMGLKDLNHFTINASDGNRSAAFYQEVFGFPVRSRQATTPGLGVGPGKMFLMFIGGGGGRGRGIAPGAGAAPAPPARRASINHACMNMENFDPKAVMKTLADYGITERSGTGPAGPLKSYITLRMPDRGGAEGGTPELYFTDPDGLLIQLQDVKYCGGGGFLGDVCLA